MTLRRANTTFVNLRARSTTSTSSSPRPSRRPRSSPRSCVSCARWSERAPDDPRPAPPSQPGAPTTTSPMRRTRCRPRARRGPDVRPHRQALKSQPVLEFIRPYTPELAGWLRDFGQGNANYDANGHFARIQPISGAYTFTNNPSGGGAQPAASTDASNSLSRARRQRCPGAATQPPPDGSAPYIKDSDLPPDGCDPTGAARTLMTRRATVALLIVSPPPGGEAAPATAAPTRSARSSTTPRSWSPGRTSRWRASGSARSASWR